MPVHRVDGSGVRDSGSKGSHACRRSTSTRGKNISDGDIFNEFWVKPCFGVSSLEDFGENLFRSSVLETTFLALDVTDVSVKFGTGRHAR